jgi:hypothetical protein
MRGRLEIVRKGITPSLFDDSPHPSLLAAKRGVLEIVGRGITLNTL